MTFIEVGKGNVCISLDVFFGSFYLFYDADIPCSWGKFGKLVSSGEDHYCPKSSPLELMCLNIDVDTPQTLEITF